MYFYEAAGSLRFEDGDYWAVRHGCASPRRVVSGQADVDVFRYFD